jgi:hypothetical protein
MRESLKRCRLRRAAFVKTSARRGYGAPGKRLLSLPVLVAVATVAGERLRSSNDNDVIPQCRDNIFYELLLFLWSDKFLEAGITPQRIEHWIEPEKCWSERYALNHRASVRYRE